MSNLINSKHISYSFFNHDIMKSNQLISKLQFSHLDWIKETKFGISHKFSKNFIIKSNQLNAYCSYYNSEVILLLIGYIKTTYHENLFFFNQVYIFIYYIEEAGA